MDPALHVLVQHEPGQHPLDQNCNRVRASKDHLPENGDHVGVGELVAALEGEQDVGEVNDGVAAEAEPGTVLVDDAAHEAVHPRDEGRAPGPGPLQVEAGEPREVVGPVELPEEVVPFVH
uniref:CYP78A53 n=1 Tax=Arundo donax TaxID=35708 RepID=A0A0A9DMR5_ARUDO